LILGIKNSQLIFQQLHHRETEAPVMGRKPDILRTIVLIFAVGLVITGFTSLQASEDKRATSVPAVEFSQRAG
jgi:uncharacterized membrane protein